VIGNVIRKYILTIEEVKVTSKWFGGLHGFFIQLFILYLNIVFITSPIYLALQNESSDINFGLKEALFAFGFILIVDLLFWKFFISRWPVSISLKNDELELSYLFGLIKRKYCIKDCKLEIIKGLDHRYTQQEHREKMLKLITEFIVEHCTS